jgi:hypothetical protein
MLQYWFFYAFNDAYGVLDHEGDWEHVTVKLGRSLSPEGAWYARHDDSHPGVWFAWSALAHEGEHPVVLSGRGTHASFATTAEVPEWERSCGTTWPAAAAAGGCRVWRTWAAETGGVVNVGERAAPWVPFLAWPGRWGATGRLGMDSRRLPPRGPAFQLGWCSGAAEGGCPLEPRPAATPSLIAASTPTPTSLPTSTQTPTSTSTPTPTPTSTSTTTPTPTPTSTSNPAATAPRASRRL